MPNFDVRHRLDAALGMLHDGVVVDNARSSDKSLGAAMALPVPVVKG